MYSCFGFFFSISGVDSLLTCWKEIHLLKKGPLWRQNPTEFHIVIWKFNTKLKFFFNEHQFSLQINFDMLGGPQQSSSQKEFVNTWLLSDETRMNSYASNNNKVCLGNFLIDSQPGWRSWMRFMSHFSWKVCCHIDGTICCFRIPPRWWWLLRTPASIKRLIDFKVLILPYQ